MEKSSKNLISLFREKPARGLPKPSPTPPRRESAEFTREKAQMQDTYAKSRRGIGTRREGEGGGNNAKLNNSSTDQHFEDSYYLSSPYCVDKMCLSPFGIAGKQKPCPI